MQAISDTLGQLKLGKPTTFEQLTVFPLFGNASMDADYLMLDEALEQEQARVVEVSESGSVPDLRFDNLGDRKVLLVDGDELIGAKQNRIINLTILVPAHTQIEIPVSCVEAGRWSHRSDEFSSAGRNMYARARASKMEQVSACMKVSGDHYSDQSAVWEDIADRSSDLDVSSLTGSMSDLYEQHEERLGAFRKAFMVQDDQVGAVFVVNGQVHGLEYFNSPRPFSQYLDKLVGSYAIEAMLDRGEKTGPVSDDTVTAFLNRVAGADGETYLALGEGEDLRLSGEEIAGGVLVADNHVVHLAAFDIRNTGARTSSRARAYCNRPVH
ncbi:MAG: DUF6569 family protein [Pseudomonadota bacterium]